MSTKANNDTFDEILLVAVLEKCATFIPLTYPAELQNEMDAENMQNGHLLRRIGGLNDALVNLPGCQDIAR
jgi:hypothetical protein